MSDKPVKPVSPRRLTRAEKRIKQKEENPGRALLMRKARLTFDRVKHAANSPVKSERKSKAGQQYYIGCSGWFYWHWSDKFYDGVPNNKWFGHYTKHFKTVELNAPFYSWPTVATIKSWMRQVKDKDFIYTVKVSELITHSKRFIGTKTLIKDFGLIADLLEKHMGCFLFQLPPSYHYTAGRLKSILSQLDPQRRNVVEFRHKSWWNENAYSAFREAGAIFCSCSGPRLPEELIKTSDDIYIRFHGVEQWYRHDYPKAEMEKWARWIKKSKAKRVWVYFNNDMNAYAIKNAKELMRQLKRLA